MKVLTTVSDNLQSKNMGFLLCYPLRLYRPTCVLHVPSKYTEMYQQTVSAARVISGTRKFDRGLTRFLRDDLDWLDVSERIKFKLCLLVLKCLHGCVPQYLAELCVPVADVLGRRNLRSATRGLLNFPRYNMTNYDRRPHAWNSLPEHQWAI